LSFDKHHMCPLCVTDPVRPDTWGV